MLKAIYNRDHSRVVRMGRKRPASDAPRLRFRDYAKTGALPAPPTTDSYLSAAASAIAEMYGNDVYGDCVTACVCHAEGVFTGNSNPPPVIFTQTQYLAFYAYFQGYKGDPTNLSAIEAYLRNNDNGCDEATVMNYWQQTGAPGGHKIAGWLAVDAVNPVEYRTALYLFENLIFGFELPDAWVNPMPQASGFTWGVAGAPDPQNGHCVMGLGYTSSGVVISTWGMTGLVTDAAMAKYCVQSAGGDLYVALSNETIALASQKSPDGMDWAALVNDFDSMGGGVPTPSPAPPPPTPSPTPPPVPSPPTPQPSPTPTMSNREFCILIEYAAAMNIRRRGQTIAESVADIRDIIKQAGF